MNVNALPRLSHRIRWWHRGWGFAIIAVIFWQGIDVKDWMAVLFVGTIAGMFWGVFALFDWLELRLFAMEVFDGGDHLVLRRCFRSCMLPLAQVGSVSYRQTWPGAKITLWLESPCRFGKEIDFVVRIGMFAPRIHPVTEELQKRLVARPQPEEMPDALG